MKTLILLISSFVLVTAANSAFAFSDIAIVGGAATTDVEPESDNIDSTGGTGFFAGVHGYMEMQGPWMLRAGAVLAQRQVSFEDNADRGLDYTFMNLEAPITVMYNFNDMIGAFGGVRLGLNLNNDCSESNGASCEGNDLGFETITYGAELGGHFRFTTNFGIEAAYVLGLSSFGEFDIATDAGIDYTSSLLINAFFIF